VANSKLFTYIEALFAVIVWGASFVASKVALQDLSPTTLVWLRFLMGVAVLGIAVIVRKQFALPDKKEWVYFALLGFLGITFHQWLQSNALETSEAGTSAWIVATSPVFIALLGWVLLKEPLDWTRTLGILLAFGGVLVVVSKGILARFRLKNSAHPEIN
jgi:drug/metabolite transporter (DMT)-like permease